MLCTQMIWLIGYNIEYTPWNLSKVVVFLKKREMIKVLSTWWIINNFERVIPEWAKNIMIEPNKERAEWCWQSWTYFQVGKVETRYALFDLFNKKDQSK